MSTLAEQEKIREFCQELALALRRITGRIVQDDPEDVCRPIESNDKKKKMEEDDE